MLWLNNILCLEVNSDLIAPGILSRHNYDKMVSRNQVHVVRRGCRNTTALVAWDSLPGRFQRQVAERIGGNPAELVKKDIKQKIMPDFKAFEFFSNYKYPDGSAIPVERQDNILLWSNNAALLNTLRQEWESHVRARAAHGRRPMITDFFRNAVELVKNPDVKQEFPHNLPENPRRLREKLENYIRDGYESLVKNYAGNSNARKVTSNIERLILALYAMPNKPFMATVYELYTLFLSGDQAIIDQGTGEIFAPSDFRQKNGKPIELSESTISNYVNKPSNRVLVDRLRNDAKFFNDKHSPHHHRQGPEFSLSKISMDDRDIPNSNVKAYYAYDITSGAIIGKSYTESPSVEWVMNCIRDMFAYLDRNGMPIPLEVEVETFLMNRLKDTVLKEGSLFKFIRWCNPGNSQEKWAETGNRLKKLGVEKNLQEGIGRFYAKLEANRPKQVMEWDDEGRRVKDRTRSFHQAVADDLLSIEKYNNQVPRSHQRYAGKTRLEILRENVNPECIQPNPALIARQVGFRTETSIMRSQYVTVQYEKYALPSPAILEKLLPNNYSVEAYYLPDHDGNIERVFLYQRDRFICECEKLEKYNTARAERTDSDLDAYTNQAKYVSKFRNMVKEGKNKLPKLQVIENEPLNGHDLNVEVYLPREEDARDFDLDYNFENDPLESF
ncbi:MAG: hypothetical protein WC959_12380 [Kiritimatiellales bacterium]